MSSNKWDKNSIRECVEILGLDPFPVDFHVVPADVLYDIAGRSMPGRYSHWSHGMSFHEQITRHDYRFGRVYELVINTNPCQAFLLDLNSDIINIMVKAHVYGHSDFFKNNREFSPTDRDMGVNVSKRAERIRQYEETYGEDEVRSVLDSALTVEFYVSAEKPYDPVMLEEDWKEDREIEYKDVLNISGKKDKKEEKTYEEKIRFSGLPTRDVLGFLITESPVEDWKKDVMSIVRADGIYFYPQIRTKIANEGFATMVHQKTMRMLDVEDHEFIEYAESNAGVASARVMLNPYWLGNQIFRDIDEKFGFEECLKVRKNEVDSSFLRNYLTEELVEKLELIRYGETKTHYIVDENDWESVKNGLINDLTDRFPDVSVIDKDYNDGGLLLEHHYYGRNIKEDDAVKVLNHLKEFWKKNVYLKTVDEKEKIRVLKSE